MKLTLLFLAILITEMGFLHALDQAGLDACYKKCEEEALAKRDFEMVCDEPERPDQFRGRCFLKCDNQFNPEKNVKETKCTPGTLGDCLVNECTVEDMKTEIKEKVCGQSNANLCMKKCYPRFFKDCKVE